MLYTAKCPKCEARLLITINGGHTSGRCVCGHEVPDVYDQVMADRPLLRKLVEGRREDELFDSDWGPTDVRFPGRGDT